MKIAENQTIRTVPIVGIKQTEKIENNFSWKNLQKN